MPDIIDRYREIAPDIWRDLKDYFSPLIVSDVDAINPTVNTATTAAQNWRAPRDPLVLDLDGNGITTSAINPSAPLLFDQDGDGTLTATGWIGAGEALVVRDLNGNGTIDSGRELFGDSTVLTSGPRIGEKAANGFEALADLDSNLDGKFDASDAAFASVKLWKDLNQNGTSEAGELFTFNQLGVASINVSGTATNIDLGGGNTQTLAGSFTRTTGQTGNAGTASLVGSLLLANNNFYRQFTDDPQVTSAAAALPQMQGSGMVRDLRPAMSLGTTQALDLQAAVAVFGAASTRDQQMAALDNVVQAWGATSSMQTSIDVVTMPAWYHPYSGNTNMPSYWQTWATDTTIQWFAQNSPELYAKWLALERFNGTQIISRLVGAVVTSSDNAYDTQLLASLPQQTFLDQAYGALKDSVYGALVVQTRLKPYLDSIELVIDENGIRFDAVQLATMLDAKKVASERDAVLDLVDLNRYALPTLSATGFDALGTLNTWIHALPSGSPLRAELTTLDVFLDGATLGSARGDIYLGDAGANTFHGSDGNDSLSGGAGGDALYGDNGNDTLDGGAGSDTLTGGLGNNVYLFGRGDGKDLIIYSANDTTAGKLNTLQFKTGVQTSEVVLKQVYDSVFGGYGDNFALEVSITGTSDKVTISGVYHGGNTATGYNSVQQFKFADGSAWDLAAIQAKLFSGTVDADTLVGTAAADAISGQTGADTLYGRDGNDSLSGGAGDDTLDGENGDDTLDGGLGNDLLAGGVGNNVYLFGLGDGQDTIDALADNTPGKANVLRFGSGVLPSQIVALRVADAGFARADTGNGADNAAFASLELSIAGTSDKILIRGYYDLDDPANASNPVQRIEFDDGTVWGAAELAVRTAQTSSLADNVRGTAGTDAISGGFGDDRINGAAGDDLLNGDAGDDRLSGGTGNDTLNGGAGNDELLGGEGDDTYCAGGGLDLVRDYSGTSNDAYKYQFGDGWMIVDDMGGTDSLVLGNLIAPADVKVSIEYGQGYPNGVTLTFKQDSTQKLTWGSVFSAETGGVIGARTFESIQFSNGLTWTMADIQAKLLITTAGDDTIFGFTDSEIIDGGAGNDSLQGNDGDDTLLGGLGNDSLHGGNGADQLLGGAGNDSIFGYTGNDTLIGGAGSDTLVGATGDDTYQYNLGDGADVVGDGYNLGYHSSGFDCVEFGSGITPANITDIQLSRGNVKLVLSDVGSLMLMDMYTSIGGTPFLDNAIEEIKFNDGTAWTWADLKNKITTLIGDANPEVIEGSVRADQIYGREDNDTLIGGLGDDKLFGETGSDTYQFAVGDGQDTIQENDNTAGNNDVIAFAAGITAASVTPTRSGQDLILAYGVSDHVSVKDWFVGNAQKIEQVRFADSTVWSVNDLTSKSQGIDSIVTGTAGNDTMVGGDGRDSISGLAGDDTIYGSAGIDTLVGGLGNDTYTVDNVGTVVIELASQGTDIVNASVSYILSANVEKLNLTGTAANNGTGNTLANVITGNSGDNILDGGTGNDTLVGGAGNDTYILDVATDVVTENVNEGIDTVKTGVTYTLGANLENLILTGTGAVNGSGNALANVMTGNTAANVLNGGAGADLLIGGAGNDSYVVDDAGDVVTELANEGTDLVTSSISSTLATNVENLTLSGAANLNGTGNALLNTLTGNAGANALDGGAGADTMVGGAGNDTYTVDNAGDVTTEAASAGTDSVVSSVNWTLSTNLENLTLSGSANITGTGNTAANVLTGNAGNNLLSGGSGADTMVGGLGSDTYVVDNTADVVTEGVSAGTDLVNSAVTYTLSANVENLTLTGTTAIKGTGNALDNVLTGNSGANTLTGNAGNDTLDGKAGADVLVGGTGNDTYWLGRGNGADSVTENDATAGNTDVARFDASVANDQLWFRHVGNNLEVSIIGTSDKLTLTNWYLGNQYHVEQFKTSNGKTLLDSQVNNLVNAMAAFSPPAAGQTTLSAAYATALNPVIVANWQ